MRLHRHIHPAVTIILLLLGSMWLAGCDASDLPPAAIAPICKALVGPIKYNTTDVMSQRYAAYLLSLDLHERNQIGLKLGCPQFKKGAKL